MKKYFFTFCFLGVISALSSQESRTENNGNLILEDIPAIPGLSSGGLLISNFGFGLSF